MANISSIKLPNGTTYNLKDNGALPLTGGAVTGSVTFGNSISVDEATLGDLIVNGSASFTNNLQVNTINGVIVGDNPKFTDTVTTATTTGSGNAITSITASNGALTVTKGSTFLTSEADPVFTASAAHGITSSDITKWNGKQAALVSGTNIKTVNGNSLLGSGNLLITQPVSITTTLTVAGWSSDAQTVTATGVTSSNTVIISPSPSDMEDYTDAGIVCTAQGTNTLTFECDTIPSSAIDVNVVII